MDIIQNLNKHNLDLHYKLSNDFDINNYNDKTSKSSKESKLKEQSTDLSSFKSISYELLKLIAPLFFVYLTYVLIVSLTYYFVSNERIEITEAKGLLVLFQISIAFNSIWAITVGYEIKCSNAFGKKNIKEIKNLTNQLVNIYFYLILILVVLGVFIFPLLLKLANINQITYSNFCSEIIVLSFSYPLFALVTIFIRMSNSFQIPSLLYFYPLVKSLSYFVIGYIVFNVLNIVSIPFGLTSALCFLILSLYLYYELKKINPYGICDLDYIRFLKFNEFKDLLKFSIYPALNYVFVLLSLDILSYCMLIKGELEFTLICLYLNIYSFQFNMYESVTNAMTILVSYTKGEEINENNNNLYNNNNNNNNNSYSNNINNSNSDINNLDIALNNNKRLIIKKIYSISLLFITAISFVFFILFIMFKHSILKFLSKDERYLKLALNNANFYSVILFSLGYSQILSEFLIVMNYTEYAFRICIWIRYVFHLGVSVIFLKLSYGIKCILNIWLLIQIVCIVILYNKVRFIYKILLKSD